MKILFISENPHTAIGGIENDISHISDICRQKGMRVEYLNAKEFKGIELFGKNFVEKKELEDKLLEISPHVIHIFGFSSFFLSQALHISKKVLPNVKLIYTPCYHPFSRHNRPFLAFLFFYFFLKKGFNNVDTLIALSPKEKEFFTQYIDKRKIHIIPNGIDITSEVELKEKPVQPSVLFVGRDDHNKRLDFILANEGYFRKKNIQVSIVTTHLSNSNDVFTFYSKLSISELHDLYKNSSVLVVPSKYESFSIVSLEAMLYGTPILISSNVQIKSFFKNKELLAKVFEYNNNEVFLEKLEDILYMDDEVYQNLSQNNITFAKEFDWEKIVKKIEMLYAQ